MSMSPIWSTDCFYNTQKHMEGCLHMQHKSFKAIVLTLTTSHHKTASLNTHRVAQVTYQQCFCFRVFAQHKHHGICACSTTQLCSYVFVQQHPENSTILASRSGLKEITGCLTSMFLQIHIMPHEKHGKYPDAELPMGASQCSFTSVVEWCCSREVDWG